MGRNELCFCGSGKKQKRCHADIDERSRGAKVIKFYTELDMELKEFHSEHKCTCCKGCKECCDDYFAVSETEFAIIMDYIIKHMGREKAEEYILKGLQQNDEFRRQYPQFYHQLENGRDCRNSSDIPNKSVGSCIFLGEDGCCSVYEARPILCRTHGTCYYSSAPNFRLCSHIPDSKLNYGNMLNIDKYKWITDEMMYYHMEGYQDIIRLPYPIFHWMQLYFGEGYTLDNYLKNPIVYNVLHGSCEQHYKMICQFHNIPLKRII